MLVSARFSLLAGLSSVQFTGPSLPKRVAASEKPEIPGGPGS
jgi:hypothetical protein